MSQGNSRQKGLRTLSALQVLDLSLALVKEGHVNPLSALVEAQKTTGDEGVDHAGALLALMRAAGGSLVAWYGGPVPIRSQAEVIALFEDAIFQMHLEGE